MRVRITAKGLGDRHNKHAPVLNIACSVVFSTQLECPASGNPGATIENENFGTLQVSQAGMGRLDDGQLGLGR